MSTAEIVDVEGQQTVKLPAEIHIDEKVVSVRREGNAVILEPQTASSNDADDIYIGAGAFLRSMLAIAWSCFRHPFSTTTIDLATGNIEAESIV